jgi:hypothetical protein
MSIYGAHGADLNSNPHLTAETKPISKVVSISSEVEIYFATLKEF